MTTLCLAVSLETLTISHVEAAAVPIAVPEPIAVAPFRTHLRSAGGIRIREPSNLVTLYGPFEPAQRYVFRGPTLWIGGHP